MPWKARVDGSREHLFFLGLLCMYDVFDRRNRFLLNGASIMGNLSAAISTERPVSRCRQS